MYGENVLKGADFTNKADDRHKEKVGKSLLDGVITAIVFLATSLIIIYIYRFIAGLL